MQLVTSPFNLDLPFLLVRTSKCPITRMACGELGERKGEILSCVKRDKGRERSEGRGMRTE